MTKKNYLLLLFIFMFSILNAQQKTLLDKNGDRIRGTAIAIGKNYENTSVAFSNDPATWKLIKGKNLNTVRICWVDPWFERRGFNHWKVDAPEVVAAYDTAVKNATDNGMNIIINYHNVGEQVAVKKSETDPTILPPEDLSRMTKFWEIIAPRYKDNPNVIYEITNEPLFNFSEYLKPSIKADFLKIYNQVRKDAPDRQIIMFSFNGIHQDIESVISGYNNDIDWSKTSIGYHMYQKDNGQLPRRLSKNYRLICTEWDYDALNISYVFRVDGYENNSETLELYQHSWVDWSGWEDNTLNSIDNYLLPDATAKGYKWWDVPANSNNFKIALRAKGTSGAEIIKVTVGGKEAATFTLTKELANYAATTTLTGEVKVEYANDTDDRDVFVDYLAYDKIIKDSEDQVENTGVEQKETCGGILSETMNCNGFINYGTFQNNGVVKDYNITLRAKGINGNEKVQLLVSSVLVGEWTLTNAFADYSATTNVVGTIQVKYFNDAGTSDTQVDKITVDGKEYEAEDMPTNTGVFQNGKCGGSFSEFMQCNGYIQFPSVIIVAPVVPVQKPFDGVQAIPGIIQAETFDMGGEGISYSDSDKGNNGGQFRTDTDVDIEATTDIGKGYNVGWIANGEYLEYTVNAKAGNYLIEARVASALGNPGDLKVELDGVDLGTFRIEKTNGWQKWATLKLNNVNIKAGKNKILKLSAVNGGGFNLNWVYFKENRPSLTPIIADGIYNIESTESNQRLIAPSWDQFNARMNNPANFNDQKWTFTHLRDNTYTIQNLSNKRYLQVANAVCRDGANVTSWTNPNGDHKKWRVFEIENGVYGIVPLHCQELGLDRNSGTNFNVVINNYVSTNESQRWKLISTSTSFGAKDIDFDAKLLLSPNPAIGSVTITGLEEETKVNVIDNTGKLLREKITISPENNRIDVSSFASGLYFVQLENGRVFKLVISK